MVMRERRHDARPQKVLVVDDNAGLRQLWSAWLSLWNFLVVEAKDGIDAVDTALRERPALVLMDLAMPRRDGYDATRELKQHAATATIPVVALTAHTTIEDRRRASEAGCAGFLGKPCDPDLLLTEVRRLLGPGHGPQVHARIPRHALLLALPQSDAVSSRPARSAWGCPAACDTARSPGDRRSVLRLVLVVVAPEAAREVHVPDVVRVRPPRHLHRREHVACRRAAAAISTARSIAGRFAASTSACWSGRTPRRLVAIAGERRVLGRVVRLQRPGRLAADERQRCGRSRRARAPGRRRVRLSGANWWLGRLWQSMQSIRRCSPLASASARHAVGDPFLHRPVGVVRRTHGITCRLSSVAMYSILVRAARVPVDALHAADALAAAADVDAHDGHRLGVRLVVRRIAERADLVAVELLGQWHCSHVSRAGPQVVHRRGDRARVRVERDGVKLPRARELRLARTMARRARCGTPRTSRARAGPPGTT